MSFSANCVWRAVLAVVVMVTRIGGGHAQVRLSPARMIQNVDEFSPELKNRRAQRLVPES
jgi:hypothetical protein